MIKGGVNVGIFKTVYLCEFLGDFEAAIALMEAVANPAFEEACRAEGIVSEEFGEKGLNLLRIAAMVRPFGLQLFHTVLAAGQIFDRFDFERVHDGLVLIAEREGEIKEFFGHAGVRRQG